MGIFIKINKFDPPVKKTKFGPGSVSSLKLVGLLLISAWPYWTSDLLQLAQFGVAAPDCTCSISPLRSPPPQHTHNPAAAETRCSPAATEAQAPLPCEGRPDACARNSTERRNPALSGTATVGSEASSAPSMCAALASASVVGRHESASEGKLADFSPVIKRKKRRCTVLIFYRLHEVHCISLLATYIFTCWDQGLFVTMYKLWIY